MAINLTDKKIAILGYGKEGQATLTYLIRNNFPVQTVFDLSDEPYLKSKDTFSKRNINFVSGKSYLDSLSDYDVLFRSPGIPRNHPKLLAYPNQSQIYSHLKLFFDLCPCPIIAVTGTKGKTTTASLIKHILSESGKHVFLGGNIGEPPLNFLEELAPESIVVLEVSSFQAQDLHISPNVGVILDITQDHLDDGSFKAASHQTQMEYIQAKLQLIANQNEFDYAILHPNIYPLATNYGQGHKTVFDPTAYASWDRQIPGAHNLQNIAAAAQACGVVGITEQLIKSAVSSFTGVKQRLQTVSEKNGVKYVNDSASTNPDSTIAAIKSFSGPLILIMGGSDKNLDYNELAKNIKSADNIKAVVVIGELTPKLVNLLNGFRGQILTGAKTMSEIIAQTDSVANPGDTVLLSPAAASFDMFKNSKDRGQQFNATVK